jgi:tetratricopeptide (TPR) repeat protein
MFRCNFQFKRFARLSSFLSVALLFALCASSHAQNLRPDSDSAPEDRKAIGTVSVRDLSIPPKAFENFQRGLQELHKQDPARSIHYFSKAIEKYPRYYEAYYHLGVAQKRLGQEDKAMATFQTAIDLSAGKYALAEYAYALLQCKHGKALDAERTVRYALELDQDKPIGEVVLGTVLLYEHRPEEAERSAREALSLDASNPDAYLVLAGVHGEKGDYLTEVEDLDAFLNLEPDGPRTGVVKNIRQVAENMAARTMATRNNTRTSTAP